MTSQDEILFQSRKELLTALGNKIQKLREQQGLSQMDLAAKMIGKFDTTNISRIESGRTNPTIFTLHKIANALEIPVKRLFEFSDEDKI